MKMLRLHINQDHPQPRHIERAASILRSGGVAIYPTDTTYGLGCDIYHKRSIERIIKIKGLDPKHQLSFICSDLSDIARYAQVDNTHYRVLRQRLPGPYTFVLPATKEVPRIVMTRAKTVGIRVPDCPVLRALVESLGHPLITTTVGKTERVTTNPQAVYYHADDIVADFSQQVDVFLDASTVMGEPSSIIDLTEDPPVLLRQGAGDIDWLEG